MSDAKCNNCNSQNSSLTVENILVGLQNPEFLSNLTKAFADAFAQQFVKPKITISDSVKEAISNMACKVGNFETKNIDPNAVADFEAVSLGVTPEGFALGGFTNAGFVRNDGVKIPVYNDNDPFNLINKGIAGVKLRHPFATAATNPTSVTEEVVKTKPAEMTNVISGYETLASVLALALEQAQNGKGNERHQVGNTPFSKQPICELARFYGVGYNFGQAAKKAHETQQLTTLKAKQAELLGAINYLAAAYIVLSEQA